MGTGADRVGEGARAVEANQRAALDTAGALTVDLRLIGGFEFRVGESPVRIGVAAQRLLALLAARETPVPRPAAAVLLWPACPVDRATANLRTLVWRLQRSLGLLDTAFGDLRLASQVHVDVHSVSEAARVLLTRGRPVGELELHALATTNFYDDLLPDWPEVWLVDDRERFRQLRLHALEALSLELSSMRRHRAAIDAGLTVVRTDPLRESGYFALISAYLEAERHDEAWRAFHRYASLIRTELRIVPSQRLVDMIRAVAPPSPPDPRAGEPKAAGPAPSSEAPAEVTVARIFRALGDPSRLRLLEFLLDGEHTVTECVAHIGLSQGRVSSHLAFLAECGCVEVRRTARTARYTMVDERVVELVTQARALMPTSSHDHEE